MEAVDGGRLADYTTSTYERRSRYPKQQKLFDPAELRLPSVPEKDLLAELKRVFGMKAVEAPVESIMQEAHRIINGERDGAYGHPTDNFRTIGELWTVLLSFRSGTNVVVSSQDVALMMILMKVARSLNKASRDNLVDVAGYAGCAAKIAGFDQ